MAGGRIAVVEDEADLREVMVEYLRAQGLDAIPCADGTALDAALAEGAIEAVLLDLNLPREGGLSIARRLHALPGRPAILMVTALADTTERVVGLELGADDYIGKPFELRELLARLRSVLRRRHALAPPPAAPPRRLAAELRFAGYLLLREARRLIDPAGRDVGLTPTEFDLLLALAARPGEVLTRGQLLGLPNGQEPDAEDRAIDIRITRLRRKLEPDPAHPRLIRTVRGQGYLFSPDA